MELVYVFYRLTFLNQKEYVIKIEKDNVKSLKKKLKDSSNELSLQQNDSNSYPLEFMPGSVFCLQQISPDTLSTTLSRTWSIV